MLTGPVRFGAWIQGDNVIHRARAEERGRIKFHVPKSGFQSLERAEGVRLGSVDFCFTSYSVSGSQVGPHNNLTSHSHWERVARERERSLCEDMLQSPGPYTTVLCPLRTLKTRTPVLCAPPAGGDCGPRLRPDLGR